MAAPPTSASSSGPAQLISGAGSVEVIGSMVGHDGFLVEHEAVGKVIGRALVEG